MEIESLYCNDVDLLNTAVKGTELEHHQLQRGIFDGTITRIGLGESVIDIGSYKSAVLCNGAFPKDMITFGAITENGSVCRFKSRELPSTIIACLKESSEFTFNIAANSTWTGFQVKREVLEDMDLDPESIVETIQIHPEGKKTQAVINIHRLLSELKNLNETEQMLLNKQIVFDRILSYYIDAYSHMEEFVFFTKKQADFVAQKAYDFVISNSFEAPSTQDICRAAGVSARTLQRSFKRRYGITLQAFQILHRLYLARYALLFPSPDATVSIVALEYGFMHFGHFTHYYKLQFGEPPSETLKRARKKLL